MTDPLDLSMLAKLDETIAEATAGFEAFDYARALERTEAFFWWFCDDYVELVKGRALQLPRSRRGGVGPRSRSRPRSARSSACSPRSSRSPPRSRGVGGTTAASTRAPGRRRPDWTATRALLDPIIEVLTLVRRSKTEAKVSQRADVASLTVRAPEAIHPVIELGRADLIDAGTIKEFRVVAGQDLSCDVILAPTT